MSQVRVNLLPEDVRQRGEAGRRNGLIAAGFVVLLAGIGVVYWLQVQDVNNAQAELDEEQATLQALRAEVAALQEFEELRSLREQGDRMLQAAMGGEASFAGILQDIASVMPADAQLDTLTINLTGPEDPPLGAVREPWGRVTVSGQTLLGHAPGLERFLLELDKIAAFNGLFFSNSTVDDRGVSTFDAELRLGPEVLTLRYVPGLPEVMR